MTITESSYEKSIIAYIVSNLVRNWTIRI